MGHTVHRLDAVGLALDFSKIHVFPVIFKMAGAFPEVQFEHLGSDDQLIAPLQVFPAFKFLK